MNRAAWAKGIRRGMRYANALSLAGDLRAAVVSEVEVRGVLGELAGALRSLSPGVEAYAEDPGVFWLDASGLSMLHPDLCAWGESLRRVLDERGFRASVVVGFTRFGTWALARVGRGVRVVESACDERAAALEVRLERLDVEVGLVEALARVGVHTVGALSSLSEAGVAQRFGSAGRALYRLVSGAGETPLRPQHAVDEVVSVVEFERAESDAIRLLFWIKARLPVLLAQLERRAMYLSSLSLRLCLEGGGESSWVVRPASPTREEAQILELVRLRLERSALPGEVCVLHLKAEGREVVEEQVALWVENPRRDLEAANRALARLRAEWGEEVVLRLQVREGHLPEARFSLVPMGELSAPRAARPDVFPLIRRVFVRATPLPSPPPHARHEGWCVQHPVAGGRLSEIAGPFHVSGGWWRREIHRTYHYAETESGALLWMYYDRGRRRWFQQGEVE